MKHAEGAKIDGERTTQNNLIEQQQFRERPKWKCMKMFGYMQLEKQNFWTFFSLLPVDFGRQIEQHSFRICALFSFLRQQQRQRLCSSVWAETNSSIDNFSCSWKPPETKARQSKATEKNPATNNNSGRSSSQNREYRRWKFSRHIHKHTYQDGSHIQPSIYFVAVIYQIASNGRYALLYKTDKFLINGAFFRCSCCWYVVAGAQ